MRRDGFSLVEILIILAVVGAVAALVVPRISWSFGSGKEGAYESDRKALQRAVDGFQKDHQKYPTYCGCGLDAPNNGTPSYPEDDSVIRVSLLVDAGYLEKVPVSVGEGNYAEGAGSYQWYVDSYGKVRSDPVFAEGVYP